MEFTVQDGKEALKKMTLHIINYYCFESHDRQEQDIQ